MLEIMTVCTGNVCRSPLAALLLLSRCGDLDIRVSSAGTRARDGMRMPQQSIATAVSKGVIAAEAHRHSAHLLTESSLATAHLILAMSRSHRRQIVEIAPHCLRSTFTLREFGRLAGGIPDDVLLAAMAEVQPGQPLAGQLRFKAAVDLIGSRRGVMLPPRAPEDDDVVDPFGRSDEVHQISAAQMEVGLLSVERVLRLSLR